MARAGRRLGLKTREQAYCVVALDGLELGRREAQLLQRSSDLPSGAEWLVRPVEKLSSREQFTKGRHSGWVQSNACQVVILPFQLMFRPLRYLDHALLRLHAVNHPENPSDNRRQHSAAVGKNETNVRIARESPVDEQACDGSRR